MTEPHTTAGPDHKSDPQSPASQATSRANARDNILFAFGVAIALAAAWFARDVVLLIYASALFAVVLTPLVRVVERINIRGWHPNQAVAIGFLIALVAGISAVFLLFAMPPVVRDLQAAAAEAPQRAPEFAARIHQLPFLRGESELHLRQTFQSIATNFGGWVVAALPSAAGVLGRFVMGGILTVYFMLEGPDTYQWFLSFVPFSKRVRLDAALQRAEVRMGKWLLGQGSLMLLLGGCSLVVFAALHLRYYYLLAVLMGLFNIVPVAGAFITVALTVVVASLDSWTKVIGVLVFYTIYAQIENAYLTPRIMKQSVDLPGLAIIVSFLLGAAFAGVLGAVIAVPSAVLVAVLMDEYLVHHDRTGPA
jgi:predicted PurR-regulated permease PerM